MTYPKNFLGVQDILFLRVWKSTCIGHYSLKFETCSEISLLFDDAIVSFQLVILAVSIPQLANFITLIGAFSSSALAIILPPLFEEIVRCADGYHGCNFVRLLKNSLVFFLGLVGMVMGTYVAILSIIEDFQKNSWTLETAKHTACSGYQAMFRIVWTIDDANVEQSGVTDIHVSCSDATYPVPDQDLVLHQI